MINYKYEEIKCPKCGKSHFRVKRHNTDFGFDIIPAVFIWEADEEYKDGVLQNPKPVKPVIEKFKCLECGCNFRTETYPANGVMGVPNIINEDEEITKQKEVQEEVEKVAESTGAKLLEDDELSGIITYKTYKSNEPATSCMLDTTEITAALYGELKDKIEDISKRLDKIEDKLNDK